MPKNITVLDLAVIIDTLVGCAGVVDGGTLFKYNPKARERVLNVILELAEQQEVVFFNEPKAREKNNA